MLALTFASVIWGAASPIFKWSMQEIPPYTFAFIRFMIASLILFPFVYKKLAIKKSDLLTMLILGGVGITLNIAFFYIGLKATASINVPIIEAATPIFLMIGSFLYLHEKIKKKIVVGTVLSLFGVILIIIEPLLIAGPNGSLHGNLLIFLSMFAAVIYTLLLKKFALPYPVLTIVFWTFFFGALLFLPAFVVEGIRLHPFTYMDGKSYIGIIYGAIFSSTMAFLFYNFGVKYVKGSEVGIFMFVEPIVTILVALPLLGEKITLPYIIGSIIVFIGIFVAEIPFTAHHHHLLSKKVK